MATARKRKRGPVKGRTLVAMGLGLFVAIAVVVVWRRSVGDATAHEMRQLEIDRRALVAERTTLRRDLNEMLTRRRIVAAATKRLGMKVAADAQTRALADSIIVP